MHLNRIHHVAVICSDYAASKRFYVEVLGLRVIGETYRESRGSYKLDLAVNDTYVIELFSFPNPPPRPTQPEARGLRHLAFEVEDVLQARQELEMAGIPVEPIRVDETTGKSFTFLRDPDDLPIELYQS
jgi:glyoxylase I family protein